MSIDRFGNAFAPARRRSVPAIAGLVILTCMAVTAPAGAEIIFGAGVASHSPNFLRVEVNGVFIPGDGATAGWWYYDWGDGTCNAGFFPMFHRYAQPGDYTIWVGGWNDLGDSVETSFSYTVPAPPPTDVSRVVLARTFTGLKESQTRSVLFTAFDAAGNLLGLDGRSIEVYSPVPDVVDVAVDGGAIQVTARGLGGRDAAAAWICVYVDAVECERPLFVIVNRNDGVFAGVEGEHSAFYLPSWFFDDAYVPEADHAKILDLAFDEFAWAIRNDNEIEGMPQVQGVSYAPPVHGANGNPLVIGDSAGPVNGSPRVDILFHETGHNFQSRRQLFLTSGIASGALYQETLAEWHVQFACNRILSLHDGELSLPARASLIETRDSNRAYHLMEFQNYIAGGMVFDFNTIMPSHVLVEKIYELCDIYGWERLRRFYDYFDIPRMAPLSAVYGDFGGATDVRRLSALVGVLGLTFEQDLRPTFLPLNFPIDDAFHDAVWSAMLRGNADFDGDGDVDLDDYAVFADCAHGPGTEPAPGSPGVTAQDCLDAFDFTFDDDVDTEDFAVFQAAFGSGSRN